LPRQLVFLAFLRLRSGQDNRLDFAADPLFVWFLAQRLLAPHSFELVFEQPLKRLSGQMKATIVQAVQTVQIVQTVRTVAGLDVL
jgi:hypothetical protein